MTFLEHVGDRELNLNDFQEFRYSTRCAINYQQLLYIVRSDKLVNYQPNSAESTFYHKNAALQQT